MKIYALVFLTLVASIATANQKEFDLDLQIKLNKKQVASPRVIVQDGQASSISFDTPNETVYLDILAQGQKSKGFVMLNFNIRTQSKTTKEINSKLSIIAKENQQAEIETTDNNGQESFAISVNAHSN